MENEINLNKERINSVLNSLLKSEDEREKIKNTLSEQEKQKLEAVMSDPNKIKAILATDEAKKLLKMLKDKRE